MSEYRPAGTLPLCHCGKPATLVRDGRNTCKACALKDNERKAEAVLVTSDVPVAPSPEEIRLRAAEQEALIVCTMGAGYRKARDAWREKYADLVADDPAEE